MCVCVCAWVCFCGKYIQRYHQISTVEVMGMRNNGSLGVMGRRNRADSRLK